jgi:hypothetical protein
MRRREFITLIGSAAAAWPLAGRAQTSRRLGILTAAGVQSVRARGLFDVFTQALRGHGWIEGQNVSFEYRFGEGKVDVLAKLAEELVQMRVDVIFADSTQATSAARNATQTVPIWGLHRFTSATMDAISSPPPHSISKRTMRRPTRLPYRGRLARLDEVSEAIRPDAAPG